MSLSVSGSRTCSWKRQPGSEDPRDGVGFADCTGTISTCSSSTISSSSRGLRHFIAIGEAKIDGLIADGSSVLIEMGHKGGGSVYGLHVHIAYRYTHGVVGNATQFNIN